MDKLKLGTCFHELGGYSNPKKPSGLGYGVESQDSICKQSPAKI